MSENVAEMPGVDLSIPAMKPDESPEDYKVRLAESRRGVTPEELGKESQLTLWEMLSSYRNLPPDEKDKIAAQLSAQARDVLKDLFDRVQHFPLPESEQSEELENDVSAA